MSKWKTEWISPYIYRQYEIKETTVPDDIKQVREAIASELAENRGDGKWSAWQHFPLSEAPHIRSADEVRREGFRAGIEAAAKVVEAAKALRNAQRAYMSNRGNEDLGKAVGDAAEVLDRALAEQKEDE